MHRRLTELLAHRVEQLRLVLLTRSDPPLPLHRLRLSDELGELRSRDLAFDAADATYLFEVARPSTSTPTTRRCSSTARRAGRPGSGWPRCTSAARAGQAAAELRGGRPVRHRLPRGGGARQPAAGACGSSCSGRRSRSGSRATWPASSPVSSEPSTSFETLEASNAFVVSLGPGRQWFRYHACSARCCSTGCESTRPELVPELHRDRGEMVRRPRPGHRGFGPRRRRGGLAAAWGACSSSRASRTW